MKPTPHTRHLFDLKYSGRTLSIAIGGRGHRKTYIGSINGQVAALRRSKGELLRALVTMARTYPKDFFRPEVARLNRYH